MTPRTPEEIERSNEKLESVMDLGLRAHRARKMGKLAKEEARLEEKLAEIKEQRWVTQVAEYLTRVLELCEQDRYDSPTQIKIFGRTLDEQDGDLVLLALHCQPKDPRLSYSIYRNTFDAGMLSPEAAASKLYELVPKCSPEDIVRDFPKNYDAKLRELLPNRIEEFRKQLGLK